MQSVSVLFSAYNGLNISSPDSPVVLSNCTIRSNRGNYSMIVFKLEDASHFLHI